ncbi:MAG TPA: alpha/beta hydrolase, partial [Casimicrobiaceae bacterium]
MTAPLPTARTGRLPTQAALARKRARRDAPGSPRDTKDAAAATGTRALHPADLRGLARLATEATVGITDLVEAMHGTILRTPAPIGPATSGPTRGIPGLVYRSIRGITSLVGTGVDALLGAAIAPASHPDARSPRGLALQSVLNGVIGDHLDASDNPLALPMSFRRAGDHAAATVDDVASALAAPPTRLVLLVHGLCMNDLQWQRAGHDHGEALARDLGCMPLYLRYNTGRPIAANGRAFADLLEALWQALPAPRPRLAIVGHSMGGLVARRACHHAGLAGHGWLADLDTLVFLGTPHLGAPLERAGRRVDRALELSPYVAPFQRLGATRSAGIRDLAHGLVDDGGGGSGPPPALPSGVRCCAVAASLRKAPR